MKFGRVLSATPVLFFLPLLFADAKPQEPSEVLPKVVQHDEPQYPLLARTANIQGDVVVKFSTDGQSVQQAEAQSGPPLLQKVSVDNVRTWKFAAHTPGTFHVTFRYKIQSGSGYVSFLEPADIVQVVVDPPALHINWAQVSLGKWNARLTSAHGQLSEEFDMPCSGPDEEWLEVHARGNQGEATTEEEYGHREGDFLVFSLKLTQPDGSHPETLLIGRMAGNRIVGTFLDESGISGKRTAIRAAPHEKK